jgi:AcrR family transcriptional regulator
MRDPAALDTQIPTVLDTVGMRARASRAEQVGQNRARVLAAARRVFLARGYAGATVDAIAEEAGFSKGVVYSQFESKADMFLELLAARISERAAENAQLAEPGTTEQGTTEQGTTGQGTTEPGTTEPGTTGQGAAEQDGAALARAAIRLVDSQERAEPEWTMLVLEFRVHAARVPELNKRYAELHERTVTELAAVFARLHEQAGSTPLYPVRSLAELILALGAGTALERAANPAALPTEHVGGYAARTIGSAAGRDGQP